MGDYTYDNFVKYIKFRMGQRTDLSSVDSEDLYGLFANRAYRALTSKNRIFGIKGFHNRLYFPELEVEDTLKSTVAGDPYVGIPTGTLIVREIWDRTNDRTLENISWKKYRSYTGRANANARGQPTEWTRRGFYIYLHPTPAAVYNMTIDYRKKITSNISGSVTTAIGGEWDDPIVQLGTYMGLMWMNKKTEADDVKVEFKETVADMLGIYFRSVEFVALRGSQSVLSYILALY